jgi:hypothetical protein
MERNEVNEAFELLLEEIEAVANDLNDEGAEACKSGDYERARQAIEQATRLSEFRERVKALQSEWAGLLSGGLNARVRTGRRQSRGRLPRGLRTPEDAFRRPILESLVEPGGSAPIADVLARVEQKMRRVLNSYDRQPLPSDRRSVRWKNTAQWCRNTLVREGLMRSNSPHGVWEISDKGRRWLQQQGPEE